MNKMDVQQTYTEEEYEVQFFGFNPKHFLNGMYNIICEYKNEAFIAIKEALLNKYKVDITQKQEEEMKLKAQQRLDEKFDSAESYLLKNVFKIPDHLVLPEDLAQVESCCTETEMTNLDDKIQNVVNRIIAVKKANGLLEKRMSEIDHLQSELSTTLDNMKKTRQEVHTQTNSSLQTVTDIGKIREEFRQLEMT